MIEPDSVVTLPGARRHLAGLAAELETGRNCVWVVPDAMVDDGGVQALLYELESRFDGHRIPAPVVNDVTRLESMPAVPLRADARPAPSWARDRFNLSAPFDGHARNSERLLPQATTSIAERASSLLQLTRDTGADPMMDLISADYLHGKVLTLRAWDEPEPNDVGTFLVRFASMTKDSTVPPRERVRLLVVARERDVTPSALERVDPVTTAIKWWWGVVGRLDTAVVVAEAKPLRLGNDQTARFVSAGELVVDDVIAEVAGPDLRLAAYLSSSWDGRNVSLFKCVTTFVEETKTRLDVTTDWRGGPERPPLALRPAWARGLVDRWDGEVRVSPAAMPTDRFASMLDRLVWRGQARALNPVVDRLRIGLEKKIKSNLGGSAWAALTSDEERGVGPGVRSTAAQQAGFVLELNRMVWAVRKRLVRLSRADEDLLYCLRDVRNALAHLVTLTDSDLDRLTRVVLQAEGSW